MRAPTPILLALAASLCGCHPAPTISQISESSLTVDQHLGTTMAQVRAEAERGCGLYGRTAFPVSDRCVGATCATRSYLFACRRPGEGGTGAAAGPGPTQSTVPGPGAGLLASPPDLPPPPPADRVSTQELPPPAAGPAPTRQPAAPPTPAPPLGRPPGPAAASAARSGSSGDPCAPYAHDPVQRLRCGWVTGPERDRYVPSVGRDASLQTQMNCIPDRDDPARYAACVARGS
jgi:hypothetical protein